MALETWELVSAAQAARLRYGQFLAVQAADVITRLSEAAPALAAVNAGEIGILRLAAFATAGGELISQALAKVIEDHANHAEGAGSFDHHAVSAH